MWVIDIAACASVKKLSMQVTLGNSSEMLESNPECNQAPLIYAKSLGQVF